MILQTVFNNDIPDCIPHDTPDISDAIQNYVNDDNSSNDYDNDYMISVIMMMIMIIKTMIIITMLALIMIVLMIIVMIMMIRHKNEYANHSTHIQVWILDLVLCL